jgi:parallel beta-helix repeat protein
MNTEDPSLIYTSSVMKRKERMKKLVYGIMLMLLINMSMLAFCFNSVKADAKTIYVNADNKSGPWDGTKAHPYQNITVALESAIAGTTIYVYDGAYNENIVINETVSLLGENSKTTIIDGSGIGTVVEIAVNNVMISGFTINNSGQEWPDSGLTLAGARSCTISGNYITNNLDGIRSLDSSSNNSISKNSIMSNLGNGISLYYSSNNSIRENSIISNNGFGIFLHASSSNNSIEGNEMVSNHWGIELDLLSNYNSISGNEIRANDVDGIKFEHSMNNTASGNSIQENNECGVRILGTSEYNCIFKNDITSNSYGILLSGSSTNNTIFHNNFVGNQQQALADDFPGNQWDDGYPSGGNYWSDYRERYSNASEIDNSGLWNMPYMIDSVNRDHYPLMSKYVISGNGFFEVWFKYLIAFLVLFILVYIIYLMIRRRKPKTGATEMWQAKNRLFLHISLYA